MDRGLNFKMALTAIANDTQVYLSMLQIAIKLFLFGAELLIFFLLVLDNKRFK